MRSLRHLQIELDGLGRRKVGNCPIRCPMVVSGRESASSHPHTIKVAFWRRRFAQFSCKGIQTLNTLFLTEVAPITQSKSFRNTRVGSPIGQANLMEGRVPPSIAG